MFEKTYCMNLFHVGTSVLGCLLLGLVVPPVTLADRGQAGFRNCAEAAQFLEPNPQAPVGEQERVLRQVVRACPELGEARANLASVLLKRGALDEAKAGYQAAFALREDPIFLIGLARVAVEQGQLAEARESYQKALSLDSSSSLALQGLAYVDLREGHFAAAEEGLRRAAQLTPEDPVLFYNLGQSLSNQGKQDEAASAFRAALERRPEYSEAREALARILLSQSQFDESEQILREALDRDNSDVLSGVMLASVYERRGQPKAAEKILSALEKKAPERVKQDAFVRLARAVLRIKRGKLKDGLMQLQDLEKDLQKETSQQLPGSRLNAALGWAYLQQGDVLRAMDYLRRAHQENPQDQTIKINLEVAESVAGPRGVVLNDSSPPPSSRASAPANQ